MALGRDTAITWLGHASLEMRSPSGLRIIVDPWLTGNPKTPEDRKTVEGVDLMLVTHGHSDHTGDVVAIATEHKPVVAGQNELMGYLASLGVENTVGFNKGGTIEHGGVLVTMTHAFHSSSMEGADGSIVYTGEPAGFVVTFENDFKVYIAGDTTVFGDMRLIGELHQPDLAILPIGDHYTMGPKEAAMAVRLLGVKHVLPYHYGTFPTLVGRPEDLAREAGDVQGLEVHAIQPGETLT
jgi:L-ascorbate metabolism protein UlaG (beta-lactamase superfamily)